MKTLRLILGDQLNQQHSWFNDPNDEVTYLMAEMRQETDYVKHHIQKIVAFFESMRNFKNWLNDRGHNVIYLQLDNPHNKQELTAILKHYIQAEAVEKFEYQFPDEYRLDQQLKDFCKTITIATEAFDTEHFYTERHDLESFFKGKKQLTMEYFYRNMRKKHGIMMAGNQQPEGGKWNFDKSNRKSWDGNPKIPHERGFRKDVSAIIKMIDEADVNYFGNIDATNFSWPTSRADSLKVLNYFCKNLLVHFGDYQDAMAPGEAFLFHSRLSFAMNSKMLSPSEVINTVIDYYYNHKDVIDISQVEGFVRQILGWREYMRGVYWKEMPGYAKCNALDNQNKLPEFYWTADTKMNCLRHAIKQSLDHAYAHHIQRLMIIGNYALLTQTDPNEVDAWYLGVYIDAIEWVEITNTRGMSQFADGGIVATKPYVSSGNYINKMSTYCAGCHYNVKKSVEEDACPFNSLYWSFLDDKRQHFNDNHRMTMMMSLLNKKDPSDLQALKAKSLDIINNPGKY